LNTSIAKRKLLFVGVVGKRSGKGGGKNRLKKRAAGGTLPSAYPFLKEGDKEKRKGGGF